MVSISDWWQQRRLRLAINPEQEKVPVQSSEILERHVWSKTRALEKDVKRYKERQIEQMRQIGGMRAVIDSMKMELRSVKESEKRARFLAFHDELTSLPNRRHLIESLGCALRLKNSTPSALALVVLEVQGLDAITDRCGHDMTRRVLKIVAARIWNAVRAEDLVCRVDDREFSCLLHGLSKRSAVQEIAATLRAEVLKPVWVDAAEFWLRVNIGVAIAPIQGIKPDQLLAVANRALCLAKKKQVATCFPVGVSATNALRIVPTRPRSD